MGETEALKREGERLGREGLAKRVIELVEAFDGSYKGAIILAGRLRAIAVACRFDDYWEEKAVEGYRRELCDLRIAGLPKVTD